jgi:hypothetical protein
MAERGKTQITPKIDDVTTADLRLRQGTMLILVTPRMISGPISYYSRRISWRRTVQIYGCHLFQLQMPSEVRYV